MTTKQEIIEQMEKSQKEFAEQVVYPRVGEVYEIPFQMAKPVEKTSKANKKYFSYQYNAFHDGKTIILELYAEQHQEVIAKFKATNYQAPQIVFLRRK